MGNIAVRTHHAVSAAVELDERAGDGVMPELLHEQFKQRRIWQANHAISDHNDAYKMPTKDPTCSN